MLTPMLTGSLRLLLPFGLALSGEMAAQAESRPSFAGRSSAEWAERLAKRTQGDVTLLAKGGLAALPVVRALLADIDAGGAL